MAIRIHYWRLTNAAWKVVEERIQSLLSRMKGKFVSLGGRLILINSVLTNMVHNMVFSSCCPKEFFIDWIISYQDSSDKEIVGKINIDWQNGM